MSIEYSLLINTLLFVPLAQAFSGKNQVKINPRPGKVGFFFFLNNDYLLIFNYVFFVTRFRLNLFSFKMQIVIYNKSDPSENVVEVFHDMPNCSCWVLSPVIFIKVIRGW